MQDEAEKQELWHRRQALRLQARKVRDDLDAGTRLRASEDIRRRLCGLTELAPARSVLLYCSFRSEVATEHFFRNVLDMGKIVCAPLTLPEEKRLLPIRVERPELELQPGFLGLPEPRWQADRVFAPQDLDIVFVPGLLFDSSGHRLGYGGGYYDRFLSRQAPQALRIGLAFSCQMTKAIPAMAHDARLDMVVTEGALWRF